MKFTYREKFQVYGIIFAMPGFYILENQLVFRINAYNYISTSIPNDINFNYIAMCLRIAMCTYISKIHEIVLWLYGDLSRHEGCYCLYPMEI